MADFTCDECKKNIFGVIYFVDGDRRLCDKCYRSDLIDQMVALAEKIDKLFPEYFVRVRP